MTHIWTVTTGWDYENTCGVTFAFDNEVSARRVAHDIDTVRMKYEAALESSRQHREAECAGPDGEIDWAKYSQYREDYPFPPDDYVLEATGQRMPVGDYTQIQGPIQVLS